MKYFCPKCQSSASQSQTGNGGDIFVAEVLQGSRDVECYDPDVKMFECDKNKSHIFYME